MKTNVREIEPKDIPHIADYWTLSDSDHMVGMGVDLDKLPTREGLTEMLIQQIASPYKNKESYALIWEIAGKAVGHCNINQIEYGKQAHMHLHLWSARTRKKGAGSALVKQSIPFFFKNFELETLYCEPYALNPAPNKTLPKIGFEFVKTLRTIPGASCFEQDVNQWILTKEEFRNKFM